MTVTDQRSFMEEENPTKLRKQILGLETLLELTRSLMVVQERSRLDGFLLLTVMGLLSVSRAALLTREGGEDRFRLYARGVKEEEIREAMGVRPSGVFARRMRVARGIVDLRDGGLSDRETGDVEILLENKIRYAVPIRVKEKLNGILFLGERVHAEEFSEYENQMLRSILDIGGVVMDNTDLYDEMREANRSMEEQNARLREMDDMKTQFLSNVGHELRTPITCVVGFAECLRYSEVDDERRVEFATNIIRQSERLSNLIDQVLDLSEFTHKQIEIDKFEGDLNQLVQEVTDSFQVEMEEKKVSLDLELSPSLPKTAFDRERTRRALRNLVDNAIKFSGADGKVLVRSAVDGDQVTVSIADEGIGIPEDALSTIFDPFRQVDGSETRAHGGAGIGLSLVKEIVESQQGSVSVSSSPGEGSVFTIRLPRNPDDPAPISPEDVAEEIAAFRPTD